MKTTAIADKAKQSLPEAKTISGQAMHISPLATGNSTQAMTDSGQTIAISPQAKLVILSAVEGSPAAMTISIQAIAISPQAINISTTTYSFRCSQKEGAKLGIKFSISFKASWMRSINNIS